MGTISDEGFRDFKNNCLNCMVINMSDLYKKFSEVYDECGVSDFSLSFGEAMLEYFNIMHPNEVFKKNLDLCCGTGTLCNLFKENGIETKGVDISREMLDVASNKYPDIEFVQYDVRQYHDGEKYDFITITDDALQHIINVEDVKKVVRNIYEHLRVNGLFIFDINYFHKISFEKYNKSLDDSRRLSYHPHRDGKIVRFDVEYYGDGVLLWKDQVFERDFSVEEITQILNESGFLVESCSQLFINEKISKKMENCC